MNCQAPIRDGRMNNTTQVRLGFIHPGIVSKHPNLAANERVVLAPFTVKGALPGVGVDVYIRLVRNSCCLSGWCFEVVCGVRKVEVEHP